MSNAQKRPVDPSQVRDQVVEAIRRADQHLKEHRSEEDAAREEE